MDDRLRSKNGVVEITREMLTAARDYVPLSEKEAWAAESAAKCFDRLEITAGGERLPAMYAVNSSRRSRYLMGALAGLYFGVSFDAEEGDPALMREDCYDAWAGGHVLNQLERWKRDPEARNKCFDLAADFKDLEKRFSAQLMNLLNVQNDPVARQNELTAAAVRELPGVLGEIRALRGNSEFGVRNSEL